MVKLLKKTIDILNRQEANILSAASVIMTAVLLSRVLGLLRDRLLAGRFAPEELGVYYAAFRLPNMIFAAPDVGGVARARGYAKHFEVEMVVCDKHRKRANEIASMQVIGDVEGKDVILVDDLVDTAGTLCKAAQILTDKGATTVRAITTHGVLSGKAFENIENSVLEELVITDTINLRHPSSKIRVLTVADLFAKAIHAVTGHTSISSLFI